MREVGSWIEVSEGCWVLKPEVAPAPVQEKPKPKSREYVANVLAPLGIPVDTSRATPAEVVESRAKKAQEHQDLLNRIEDKREAELEAEAKTEIETLLPIKHGQVDHRFLEVLRQIWARNRDGSISYKATLAARKQYLDEYQWRIDHNLPTTPEGA